MVWGRRQTAPVHTHDRAFHFTPRLIRGSSGLRAHRSQRNRCGIIIIIIIKGVDMAMANPDSRMRIICHMSGPLHHPCHACHALVSICRPSNKGHKRRPQREFVSVSALFASHPYLLSFVCAPHTHVSIRSKICSES